MSHTSNVVPLNADRRVQTGKPPSDPAAEQLVLAVLFQRPSLLDLLIGSLAPEDFFVAAHADMFRAMIALANEDKAVDEVSVAGWLNEHGSVANADSIAKLTYRPGAYELDAQALDQHARTIASLAMLRSARAKALTIAESALTFSGDVLGFVRSAEAAFHDLADTTKEETLVHARQAMIDQANRFAAIEEGKLVGGIPTGFADIDDMLNGLGPGKLVILAARPGQGKSALALQIATNAAVKGFGAVAFFSLEMDRDEIIDRYKSQQAKVSHDRIKLPATWNNREADEIETASNALAAAPFWIDDAADIGLIEIRAKCKRLQREAAKVFGLVGPDGKPLPLGLVVVDYLQLVAEDARQKFRSREQAVAQNCRQLKILAKKLSVPVIALSQMNRSVETRRDKEPTLADLRESGAIEQDADIICFIHNEDQGKKAKLKVAKFRGGRTGSAWLGWQGQYVKFTNLAYGESLQ